VRRTSRPVLDDGGARPRPSGDGLTLPVADPFAAGRRDRATPGGLVAAPATETETEIETGTGTSRRPRRPIYKIRRHESLRSIARDALGDSRRADEILELNRDVIDDPGHLTPGQLIELPEDARLARRGR
jgi:hypothetical protein